MKATYREIPDYIRNRRGFVENLQITLDTY